MPSTLIHPAKMPCKLWSASLSNAATVRADSGCPRPVSAAANWLVLFSVHLNGEIKSSHVSGATNASSASTRAGSDGSIGLLPPPARLTRDVGSMAVESVCSLSSRIPSRIVFLDMPVACATKAMPPRPSIIA